METILLKDYINILRKHFTAFVVTVSVCVALAGVITYLIPKSYTSSIDIYVRHKGTDSQSYYTYDGYYSTQASLSYTNTVAGFLQSLSTVDNAALIVQSDPLYKNGGYKPIDPADQQDYLSKLQKSINIKIVAPQLINVAVTDQSSVVSKLWAQSLGQVITSNLKQFNQQGDNNFGIDAVHSPITQTNELKLTLDLVIGFIIGIFVAFTVGFILEANKKQ